MKTRLLLLTLLSLVASACGAESWKFDFGSGPGATHVNPDDVYTEAKGFGFEPGAHLHLEKAPKGKVLVSESPFYFSAKAPEGNYRVTIIFGGGQEPGRTTVKAELRRLMVPAVATAAGTTTTRSFIVNVRTPKITARGDIKEGLVRLKAPRETTQEAWAWDDRLTLEFNGTNPQVSAIEITPVVVPTVYIMGDSTVCDQSGEPYTSWGQMLPAFFTDAVAIANHAESGETYEAAFSRRRIDKILSLIQPGDYFLVQFGHNDQKQDQKSGGGPFTTYQAWVEKCVSVVREHGGIPLIVTPMERREFNADGSLHPSLQDYAEAVRRVGVKMNVPVIDLNRLSRPFYEALESRGKDYSRKAFARTDNTHHDAYGAYELAKAVVTEIGRSGVGLAKYISADFTAFDPAHPDDPETFAVPASPKATVMRPLGDTSAAKPAEVH